MSVNHVSFGRVAVKSWLGRPCSSTTARRSSWTGGPGLRLWPRFLECSEKIRWAEHSRATRFSDATIPAWASSSVINRYP